MLAFGQAGVGTVRRNRCIYHFRMAQSGNHFLLDQNFVTDRAVLAFGQAGCSTGGSNSCVNDFGMAQGGNIFGISVAAVILTGEGFYTLFRTGGLGGDNTLIILMAQLGQGLGDILLTVFTISAFTAVSFTGSGDNGGFTFPDMVGAVAEQPPGAVVVDIGTRCIGCFRIASICVFQFRGGNGNINVSNSRTGLGRLTCNCSSARCQEHSCIFSCSDVSTGLGGIHKTARRIHGASDVGIGIFEVAYGTRIGFTGGILNREEILCGIAIAFPIPLVGIVEEDRNTLVQSNICTLFHIQLGTGKHRQILCDCNVASFKNPNCYVIGDGQLIVLRVYRKARQTNLHVVHLDFAVYGEFHPVSIFYIIFRNAA